MEGKSARENTPRKGKESKTGGRWKPYHQRKEGLTSKKERYHKKMMISKKGGSKMGKEDATVKSTKK